jgi:hypothetical protein
MPTVRSHLTDAYQSAAANIRFLRVVVSAWLAPAVGDESGEIATWVVVTALLVVASIAIVGVVVAKLHNTANNIQTP